jgi:hypothetical protein
MLLKCGRNYGIAVYVPKETILKEMAAKIEISQASILVYLVQELSDRTSYDNYLLFCSQTFIAQSI